jgi:uncharacterized protein
VTLRRTFSLREGRAPTEAVPGREQAGKAAVPIEFAGLSVTLDHSGAAYIECCETLVVSDLHLEKGSSEGSRGRLVPALDSHDTLIRLGRVIDFYRPNRLVCLGDSFHDGLAGERMAKGDRSALTFLCSSVSKWVWISGNHDPETPEFCEGERRSALEIGGIVLRHEPAAKEDAAQIVGHFHPKASVPAGGHRFSGRCFCLFDDLLLMPAFGTYAGGLSCSNPAIRFLRNCDPKIFLLYRAKVWQVAHGQI